MKTKKIFLTALALILTVLTLLPLSVSVFAASTYPKHENYVADDAEVLTEDSINSIRDANKTLAADYGLTIAVCTVNTTGDEEIATYARNLFTEWKLGEGILVLIAKEDNNYYFVPSVGVEDILTNEKIASIRDEYFEADFSNGMYDRAVKKVVTALKNTLLTGMQSRAAAEEASSAAAAEEEAPAEEKGTTVGSVIVGFFKVILWIVVIAVLLFIGLFVWAMFNDDVAAILQKYVFSRINNARSPAPQNIYDERLYGNRSQNGQRQGQRRPNPNNPYGNNGYSQNRSGYNRNGYPQNGYPQNPGNRGGYLPQGQQMQYGQYPQQNPNMQQRQPMNNPNYGYGQQGQQNGYGYNNYNNNGYAQQQGYPQQNPNPYQQRYNPGQQGYSQPQQKQNNYNNNRQGYNNPNNNDATVQFNIPRRN